jgi:hypothetical protein
MRGQEDEISPRESPDGGSQRTYYTTTAWQDATVHKKDLPFAQTREV